MVLIGSVVIAAITRVKATSSIIEQRKSMIKAGESTHIWPARLLFIGREIKKYLRSLAKSTINREAIHGIAQEISACNRLLSHYNRVEDNVGFAMFEEYQSHIISKEDICCCYNTYC